MRRMLLWICLLAPACTSLRAAAHAHAGLCPNDLNPNLWVDAMSTCTRECRSDQDCDSWEKCCRNVCGSRSCVAARTAAQAHHAAGAAASKEVTCAGFPCTQQGSECDVWDGQPICKCRDRCEREPSFTCASDGMTYYNRCFMDAEACSKGVSLAVVPCRFHLNFPKTNPPILKPTTPQPTTTPVPPPTEPQPPLVVSNPVQMTVRAGDTASFLCSVAGRPRPEVTWTKQAANRERGAVMRRNHMIGNMVVTNAGQLVIYNAQPKDSGVYRCTAQNPSGSAQAFHSLTVLPADLPDSAQVRNQTRCSPEECARPSNMSEDCGSELEKVGWFYEPSANMCLSFTFCSSQEPPQLFDTVDDCMQCCGPEVSDPCGLPIQQGPCKAYTPRWAYSSALLVCQPFVYGGCEGNSNNFESKEACEDRCPFPKVAQCKACRPRGKLVNSFCRSDFVVSGRLTDVTKEKDVGHALVTIEEIFKDEQMGLRFFGKEPLELIMANVDWSCPCPNVTGAAGGGTLIIMGDVVDGMAVLRPESFVGAASPRRIRRLREVVSKNTCHVLTEISSSPQ